MTETPPRTRPAGVFVVAFTSLLTLLLIRSRDLFSRVIYEEGDFAANSIITYHAKQFDQLVGNYSRVGFAHPGPAFFYIQAAGEWLLYDVLHLVPSPWNGQAVAIITLNAACVALALTLIYGWLQSWPAVVAAGGVALMFLATHELLLSSTWMPFAYFAPFLLLLIAATSVAAGQPNHLWIVVFAGGLLVHGHAEFLFFVPVLILAALAPHRRDLLAHRRALLSAAGVLAVVLLPIVLNLVLHWPGEFARYLGYGKRGVHWPWEAARYQLQFWAAHPVIALALVAGLFAAVWFLAARTPAERFLRAGVRIVGVATVAFFVYAIYGIDHLSEGYVGYFSRAMPLALMLLGAAGLMTVLPTLPARGTAVAALAIGLVAASLSGALVNRRGEVPGVPAALDAMAGLAGARPIVLDIRPDAAWAEALPLVIAGHRRGLRVCLRDGARWRLIATDTFVCTADEVAAGERFLIGRDSDPPGAVVADVTPSVVSVSWIRDGPKG